MKKVKPEPRTKQGAAENVLPLDFGGRSLDRFLNNPKRLYDLTREELLAEIQRLREENARLRSDLSRALMDPDE